MKKPFKKLLGYCFLNDCFYHQLIKWQGSFKAPLMWGPWCLFLVPGYSPEILGSEKCLTWKPKDFSVSWWANLLGESSYGLGGGFIPSFFLILEWWTQVFDPYWDRVQRHLPEDKLKLSSSLCFHCVVFGLLNGTFQMPKSDCTWRRTQMVVCLTFWTTCGMAQFELFSGD